MYLGLEDTWTYSYNAVLMGVTSTVHIVTINAGETWQLEIAKSIPIENKESI